MKRFLSPLVPFRTRLLGTVVLSGLSLSSPVAAAGPARESRQGGIARPRR
jgi:hypothetical protein